MRNAAQEQFQTLHEVIAAARLSLNQNLWDYVIGGYSNRDNRPAEPLSAGSNWVPTARPRGRFSY